MDRSSQTHSLTRGNAGQELRRVSPELPRNSRLRIVVNGSFATAVREPNDVDCALLIGPGFPQDARAEEELIEGLPFLDIHLVRQDGWDERVGSIFATDRRRNPKGMIEVISPPFWASQDRSLAQDAYDFSSMSREPSCSLIWRLRAARRSLVL